MPSDDPLTDIRVTLGRIEGVLSVKHIEYDRRLESLERGAAGALSKTMSVVSPIVALAALAFAIASGVSWE